VPSACQRQVCTKGSPSLFLFRMIYKSPIKIRGGSGRMATEWSCLRPPTGFLSIMILWHLLERCQWIVQCCLHREHCALYWRLCHRSHMFISSSRVLAPFREKPESWLAVGRRTFPRWDRTSAPVLGRGKKLIVCFVQGYNTMVKRLRVAQEVTPIDPFFLSFFIGWRRPDLQ